MKDWIPYKRHGIVRKRQRWKTYAKIDSKGTNNKEYLFTLKLRLFRS